MIAMFVGLYEYESYVATASAAAPPSQPSLNSSQSRTPITIRIRKLAAPIRVANSSSSSSIRSNPGRQSIQRCLQNCWLWDGQRNPGKRHQKNELRADIVFYTYRGKQIPKPLNPGIYLLYTACITPALQTTCSCSELIQRINLSQTEIPQKYLHFCTIPSPHFKFQLLLSNFSQFKNTHIHIVTQLIIKTTHQSFNLFNHKNKLNVSIHQT